MKVSSAYFSYEALPKSIYPSMLAGTLSLFFCPPIARRSARRCFYLSTVLSNRCFIFFHQIYHLWIQKQLLLFFLPATARSRWPTFPFPPYPCFKAFLDCIRTKALCPFKTLPTLPFGLINLKMSCQTLIEIGRITGFFSFFFCFR